MKKFRLYYDVEKELAWLQEMVNQGWAVTHFALGVYTFEPCKPGEYIYQIDLLKDIADFENYKAFMEDSGVEVICRWVRWVFVRRKAEEGHFALYTDRESLVQHYTNMKKFFLPAAVAETACAVMELFAGIASGKVAFGFLVLLLGALAVVLWRVVWKCSWKIETLKKQAE